MHGRVKVKTTAQQAAEKRLEREKKKAAYLAATELIHQKRKLGQLDDELLNLTAGILMSNPDDSTLWNIRRQIFLQMKSNGENIDSRTKDELLLTQQTLMKNPKSYGSWFHRGWTNENLPDVPDWKKELELCERFLEKDDRNFHCWDYRRFLVEKNSVPDEDELKFSKKRIDSNFSNYSSWHYRSELLAKTINRHTSPNPNPGKDCVPIRTEHLMKEFELVLNAAFTDPQDQAAWMYHRWLLGKEEPTGTITLIKWYPTEGSALVVFDKAQTKCSLTIETSKGEAVKDICWSKVGGLPCAWVWTCQHELLKSSELILIDSKPLSLSLREYRSSVEPVPAEGQVEKKKNLEWQLDSTEQIIEMEPDSKWPLLTLVVLLNAMKPDSCHVRKYDVLERLKEVDSYRKNYYSDLKSKLLIEDKLEPNQVEVNLSSLGLTSLHHCHQMAATEKLDLSHNQLRSEFLMQLRHCSRLRTIILTGNPIDNDDFMNVLPPTVHVIR